VTIAIIAVLASISFSVAIPLIKRANDANCVSNLRTLNTIATAIGLDQNDALMPRFVAADR
jgi:hypothetical protein